MLTYIFRRLLLTIPTLIGITFLVFMLIALSPGGIGAGLQQQGGNMESSKRAILEAYLDDRYGLDDPVLVQYGRWLGRISPVKFGQRAQISNTGELISPPKQIKEPKAWTWFADELPEPRIEPESFDPGLSSDQQQRVYNEANSVYANARSRYIVATTEYEEKLRAYARSIDMGDRVIESDGELRWGRVKKLPKHTSSQAWPQLQQATQNLLTAYENAVAARIQLKHYFDHTPYEQAGIPIIPRLLSLGAPDLGVSFSSSRPVKDLIASRLPVTMLINIIAIPIIYVVAIPSGMLAATRAGSWFDVTSGALYVALWSVPVVLAGVLAVGFLSDQQGILGQYAFPVTGLHSAEAENWTYLPSFNAEGNWQPGYLLDTLWHLCLPVACISYAGFAVLSKLTRAAMLDNFNADYVRTAKAKGVAPRDIIFRHVFRNSLLPLITVFVSIFPAMLSGSVVIERIFSIQGMGNLAIEAINLRDRELLLATTFMISGISLLAMILQDVLYAMADPRISFK